MLQLNQRTKTPTIGTKSVSILVLVIVSSNRTFFCSAALWHFVFLSVCSQIRQIGTFAIEILSCKFYYMYVILSINIQICPHLLTVRNCNQEKKYSLVNSTKNMRNRILFLRGKIMPICGNAVQRLNLKDSEKGGHDVLRFRLPSLIHVDSVYQIWKEVEHARHRRNTNRNAT